MKKQGSKLFKKFEDSKILAETAKNINGGLKDVTSDNCTSYGGGSDCGDIYEYPRTAEYQDYVMTSGVFDCGN